jgi:riboflavin synthase
MFTGIVEEVGTLRSVVKFADRARLVVEAKTVLEGTRPGDSINIDGVCQTVAELMPGAFAVDTLAESLKKTTIGSLTSGSRVNLERALRADSRLGGHIVQGHVSAAVPVRDLRETGNNVYLTVEVPDNLIRYCVREGSIALDGISLTIADIAGNRITVNIIPVTIENTALKYKKTGGRVNLETDIIGRYVERLLALHGDGGLSEEKLRELGY